MTRDHESLGPLLISPAEIEARLCQRLAELGGEVRWDREVVAVMQTSKGAETRVRTSNGEHLLNLVNSRWRSRILVADTRTARSGKSPSAPSRSRISRPRVCRPSALEVVAGPAALSTTVAAMPRLRRSQAKVNPVGPAPTTRMALSSNPYSDSYREFYFLNSGTLPTFPGALSAWETAVALADALRWNDSVEPALRDQKSNFLRSRRQRTTLMIHASWRPGKI
jgi:hypothetical protein